MARVQLYWENNGPDHYKEGPYVLVRHPASGGAKMFRIERYNEIAPCSTFDPTGEDVKECRRRGIEPGWQPREVLTPVVDALNARANASFFEVPK